MSGGKNVIRAAARFQARRRQEEARGRAEWEALCRRAPRAEIEAIVEAVTTNSEEPLHRLLAPVRARAIAGFWQAAQEAAARKTISAEIVVLGAAARTQPA